ncbi:hypothetical protein TIFTF001_012716 [Ficus carica]|uniref:Uncharacterized protein n=1 Tax=Ficus carica TaxID=3494 RepID=A0AA88A0H9_FICCA|nr:hypothetical protein TIFTF001_012716 [Ficus carica]
MPAIAHPLTPSPAMKEERESVGSEEERERDERPNPPQHVGHRAVTGQHA